MDRRGRENQHRHGADGAKTMTTYFVSRHSGAVEWASRRGIEAHAIAHLDPDSLQQGDVVIGTLPVNLVAEVCAKGGRYLHLVLELPPAARGRELSADEMEAFEARLEEYEAKKVDIRSV